MPRHDIIVVGASAGGVEALTALIGDLPADLPAAVVVQHVPATATSALPRILACRTSLPVEHAVDGDRIEPGRVYVAPPDRHVLVRRGSFRVVAGPKENGHRPAVDLLFRSAAAAYGDRVVGVVVSGTLDDGTAGLQAVTSRGGVGVVQDPDEALYSGMPFNAIQGDHPQHILPLRDIGKTLVAIVGSPPDIGAATAAPKGSRSEGGAVPDDLDRELNWSHPGFVPEDERGAGRPSGYTCPECHGALWTAYRPLEERAALCRKLAGRAAARGHSHSITHFESQAVDAEARADVLRRVLHPFESGTADSAFDEPSDETGAR